MPTSAAAHLSTVDIPRSGAAGSAAPPAGHGASDISAGCCCAWARAVDELLVELPAHAVRGVLAGGLARLRLEPGLHVRPHPFLLLLGDAEEHAEHADRHVLREVDDEVERTPRPASSSRRRRAVLADLRLDRASIASGREDPREQLPADRDAGGPSSRTSVPGGISTPGLEELEGGAAAGEEVPRRLRVACSTSAKRVTA